MKTAQERFMEIFHSQDARLMLCDRFIDAVEEFQKETGIKAPFSSYDSVRKALSRQNKKK